MNKKHFVDFNKTSPLTLDQLREMDGHPVWVERNETPHDGKWFIVDHADVENPDKTLYTKEGVTYSDYGVYFTAVVSDSQQRRTDMGYDYKKLLEEIKDYLSNCERMIYGEMVGAPWPYNYDGPMVYTEPDAILLEQSATAITDLLARAEAAEADRDRLREALKPNCLLCDSMHENGNCTEVGGFCTAVPAAHCPLIPRLRDQLTTTEARAEEAEKCIYAIEDDLDRGNDNDWAREHIAEWKGQKEERA